MPLPKNMSQEEAMRRMAASIRAAQSGTQVEQDPELIRYLQMKEGQQGWNLPIEPPKPDPEAEANAQIEAAANRRSSVPGSVVREGEMPLINPETGMPYFGAAPEVSPEEAKRREEMQMKTEFLRRRSQGQ